MLMREPSGTIAPMLAPQLSTAGPVRPGERVTVTLPIVNEREVDAEDVTIHFCGDGLAFDHPAQKFERIPRHSSQTMSTDATILPNLAANHIVKVWAQLTAPVVGVLETGIATVRVEHSHALSMTYVAPILRITNDGDALEHVAITATPSIEEGLPATLDLAPKESHEIVLESYSGTILATGASGERALCMITAQDGTAAAIEAELELRAPDAGVRDCDTLPFAVHINNSGGLAAHDVLITLPLSPDIELIPSLVTLDHVRMIADDIVVQANPQGSLLTLRCGRIPPHSATIVHGAFRLSVAPNIDTERISFDGSVTERGGTRARIRGSVQIDRSPRFAPQTTYLSDIFADDAGRYHTTITITNSQTADIINASVRLVTHNARLSSARLVQDDDDTVCSITPSTIAETPTSVVSIGTIPTQGRRTLRLQLEPLPSHTDRESLIALGAVLAVDGNLIDLGVRESTITHRVDLTTSTLTLASSDSVLRLGMPCDLKLMVTNSGTAPAKDVRLALDLPPAAHARIFGPAHGRWHTILPYIPPGGTLGVTLTIELDEPAQGQDAIILAHLDAANAPATQLAPVTVPTPTAPLVNVRAPKVRLKDHGLLSVEVVVENVGDGPAHNVSIMVPADNAPLARATTIDGQALTELSPTSALIEGVNLGSLEPGTYRTVTWLIAPGPTPVQARATILSDSSVVIPVTSGIITTHMRSGFATELPKARAIHAAIQRMTDDSILPSAELSPETSAALIEKEQLSLAPAADLSHEEETHSPNDAPTLNTTPTQTDSNEEHDENDTHQNHVDVNDLAVSNSTTEEISVELDAEERGDSSDTDVTVEGTPEWDPLAWQDSELEALAQTTPEPPPSTKLCHETAYGILSDLAAMRAQVDIESYVHTMAVRALQSQNEDAADEGIIAAMLRNETRITTAIMDMYVGNRLSDYNRDQLEHIEQLLDEESYGIVQPLALADATYARDLRMTLAPPHSAYPALIEAYQDYAQELSLMFGTDAWERQTDAERRRSLQDAGRRRTLDRALTGFLTAYQATNITGFDAAE